MKSNPTILWSDETPALRVTLRDLFAAFCAAGELAAQSPDFIDFTLEKEAGDAELLAKRAYLCADALLAHRDEAPRDE